MTFLRKFICLLVLCIFSSTGYAINLIRDEEIESVLKEIAKPILKTAKLNAAQIDFLIINDNAINAFFAGGNIIFINSGLIAFSEDPSLIAGVISHELGHMLGGHILLKKEQINQTNKGALASTLAGLAIGLASGNPSLGMGAMMFGQHASVTDFMKFNRAQESAADETAIRLMQGANINSKGLVNFLTHISQEEKIYGDNSSMNYYRTHPVSRERLGMLKNAFAGSNPTNSYLDNLNNRYAMAVAKIRAFTNKPEQTIAFYNKRNSDEAYYALAIAYMIKGVQDKAIANIQKLLKDYPLNPYVNELAGQIYFNFGNYNQSISYYSKANALKPKSATISWEYAAVLVKANKDLKKAVDLLEMAINSEAYNQPEFYHTLAGAYQAQNNPDEANLALAYYYYSIDEIDKSASVLARVKGSAANKIKAQDLKSILKEHKNSR